MCTMGRRLGQGKLTVEDIEIIIEMTLSRDPLYTRREIATKIGCSMKTIWRYQKELGIL